MILSEFKGFGIFRANSLSVPLLGQKACKPKVRDLTQYCSNSYHPGNANTNLIMR